MALDGADLLCVCANWGHTPAEDREAPVKEWRTYLRARALEHAVYVAGNNRSGEECSYRFPGDSRVVGPRGETHVFIDSEIEAAYAAATIDLDVVRRTREELQLIQCRVPQAYRSIVRKY